MKQPISIIVCYRNREDHLRRFVPHITSLFSDIKHEIIIVEQDDEERFKRGVLLNEGVKLAKYDLVALHDVDYLPESVDCYYGDTDVVQPVKRVNFINMDGTPRAESDIPTGYRHFKNSVDDDFYGAVTVFRKEAFFKINGFNSLYNGWGLEDADLRERIKHYGLSVSRNDGTFQALPHPDSNPGLQDENFQRNQMIFSNWRNYLFSGVNTQNLTSVSVRTSLDSLRHIKVRNLLVFTEEMRPLCSVEELSKFYQDSPEKHEYIWRNMKNLVNNTTFLKDHRDFVINNNWGYGNRAFHWMWYILVRQAPENFKFLEIGVFKGQIISLISLLNKILGKNGSVYAVTPLNKSGDKYATHPDIDYEEAIATIYAQFGLDASDLVLIEGYSNDSDIIGSVRNSAPYDLVFVDGCHDYDVVVSDLTNYREMVTINGHIVVDDSSNYLNIPDNLIRANWKGLEDVSRATRDVLEKDSRFVEVFAVGHNRIFKRIL
jgi:hypothetical protein